MLAEFVKTLEDLARRATGVRMHHSELVPEKLFLVGPDGVVLEEPVPPRRRSVTVQSLASLVAAATDAGMAQVVAAPEVYHDHARCVVLLDREDRRDTVTLPMTASKRFTLLAQLAAGMTLDVKQAYKLLRLQLAGSGAEQVTALLRRVDFEKKSLATYGAAQGSDSLGRSAEAKAVQPIPEEFIVEVPVYTTPGFEAIRAHVRVGIYVDAAAEKLELRTLPDEVEREVGFAQAEVHEMLAAATKAPVFYGAP